MAYAGAERGILTVRLDHLAEFAGSFRHPENRCRVVEGDAFGQAVVALGEPLEQVVDFFFRVESFVFSHNRSLGSSGKSSRSAKLRKKSTRPHPQVAKRLPHGVWGTASTGRKDKPADGHPCRSVRISCQPFRKSVQPSRPGGLSPEAGFHRRLRPHLRLRGGTVTYFFRTFAATNHTVTTHLMFDNLSERLERSFKILKGEGRITEINVAETLKDVRRALLDADVNYKVAKTFTDSVKAKALGQNVLTAVKPGQLLVKIVHDELAQLMGGEAAELQLKGHPAVVLMAGLQGSGKTTMSGKLALWQKTKKNRKPLLVACDVYRPAAIDQLKVLGEQVGVPVYSEPESKDPVAIAQHAIKEARAKGYDLVIVDTAGRLAVDEEMMNEIAAIKAGIDPDEILFVVDAMTGQDAVNTAKEFNDRLDFDGVVLTKLDGDTRGGAALSIRTVVTKPIKLVGTGEKLEALDVFHPDRMADRILGMGDIVSLVERAQEQFDEEEARKLQRKIQKNQFDFNDFLGQIHQIKKMGNLKDLASMIPGVGKALKDVEIDDNAFKSIEAIILSMTPKERSHPEILNTSRRTRIARGSGTTVQEVNRLIKQFDQTRKMMKMVTGSKMGRMMKAMPQMPGMPKLK